MKNIKIKTVYGNFNIYVDDDDTVVKAPAIAKWMEGRNIKAVTFWARKFNASIVM